MAATMLQIIFMQQVSPSKEWKQKKVKTPLLKGLKLQNKHRLLFPRFKDLFRQRLKLILFVAFATVEMVREPSSAWQRAETSNVGTCIELVKRHHYPELHVITQHIWEFLPSLDSGEFGSEETTLTMEPLTSSNNTRPGSKRVAPSLTSKNVIKPQQA